MGSYLNTFESLSLIDQFYLLASHLPQGTFWENCFNSDSNLGKLTKALSVEYYRLGLLAENAPSDYDIRKTNDYILNWEKSVGVPQACFSRDKSLEHRRITIEGLFSNFGGVQTEEDFIRVGLLYGYVIEVFPVIDISGFDLMFPILLINTKKEANNTIIINLTGTVGETEDFPFEFPLPFYDIGLGFLTCMFRLIVPANVDLILTTQYNIV